MQQQQSNERKLLLVCDISDTSESVETAIDYAYDNGFGLISYPLIDPKFDTISLIKSNDKFVSNIPFAYHSNSAASIFQSIYGKISPWITFNPYNNYLTQQSIKLLKHELDWSLHLGIYSVILPNPSIAYPLKKLKHEQKTNDNNNNNNNENDIYLEIAINYASAIIQSFQQRQHIIGIIPIPFDNNGWKIWKSLSLLIRDVKHVRPALILGANAPSKELTQQWFAEGVQIFFLSQDIFLTNKKGFPVLSKAHQKVLLSFLTYCDSTIILTGKDTKNIKKYCQYIRHLESTKKSLSNIEYDSRSFWDQLQSPLQPLSNNLEYVTYETFESDPIKYNKYEQAITKCLIDLDKNVNILPKKEYILMVLGAGRGPLVDAALNASKSTNIRIKLYAIEKNPHAIIILKNKNITKWKNKNVTIIESDMREWNIREEEKAHVIISELLGSFGDNELSPECLDGAQRLLRDDGISIPCKYTSYICPITNNCVYSKLMERPRDFEIPYVIHLVRHKLLSKNIAKCWHFVHPKKNNKNDKGTNERYCKLTFEINNDSIVHGFVGYFDSVLYKDVIISIHPKNKSKGMFSWFPMYFPLIKPINIKCGENIIVCLWRKCDEKCIWYEWCVIKPILTEIHNVNRRSYAVDLK